MTSSASSACGPSGAVSHAYDVRGVVVGRVLASRGTGDGIPTPGQPLGGAMVVEAREHDPLEQPAERDPVVEHLRGDAPTCCGRRSG